MASKHFLQKHEGYIISIREQISESCTVLTSLIQYRSKTITWNYNPSLAISDHTFRPHSDLHIWPVDLLN